MNTHVGELYDLVLIDGRDYKSVADPPAAVKTEKVQINVNDVLDKLRKCLCCNIYRRKSDAKHHKIVFSESRIWSG